MKFFTKAISLIAVASLTVASPVINSKRSLEGSLKCQEAINKWGNECKIDVRKFDKIDDTCKVYNKPECYNVIQKGVFSIPECKESSKEELTVFEDLLNGILSIVAVQCEVDEKGDLCPLASITQKSSKEKVEVKIDEFDAASKETCKSKKCKDAYTNIFTKLDNNKAVNSGQENIKMVLKNLKSDTCVPVAATSTGSTGSASSDASATMKYSSILFVMVGLLFNAIF